MHDICFTHAAHHRPPHCSATDQNHVDATNVTAQKLATVVHQVAHLIKMLRAYVMEPSTSSTNMNGDSPSAVPRLKFFMSWGTLAPK